MLIKFKNKMTMALQKMIDEGKRLGGLPSHIEVIPQEAADIFAEIRRLSPPGYVINDENGASARLLLGAKDLSDFELQGFVNKWKEKKWTVEFQKISIIVVIPTPATIHLNG